MTTKRCNSKPCWTYLAALCTLLEVNWLVSIQAVIYSPSFSLPVSHHHCYTGRLSLWQRSRLQAGFSSWRQSHSVFSWHHRPHCITPWVEWKKRTRKTMYVAVFSLLSNACTETIRKNYDFILNILPIGLMAKIQRHSSRSWVTGCLKSSSIKLLFPSVP